MNVLNNRQIKDGIRFCERNAGKLSGRIPQEFYEDHEVEWGTKEFVLAIATFQAVHGLKVDGKPGLGQTIPEIVSAYAKFDHPQDCLIFRDKGVKIPGARIVNSYHPDGYCFDDAGPGKHVHGHFSSKRPTAIVLHDSVTRTTAACFSVLRRRKSKKSGRNMGLGTGIMISPSGTIYQSVRDLASITWHATGWSKYAVGIDMITVLDPKLSPKSPLRKRRTHWSSSRGYLDYTDEQKSALLALMPELCSLTGVPVNYVMKNSLEPATKGYGERLSKDINPKAYSGIVAHGQISKSRWDGNRALEVLFGNGQNV